MSTAGPASATTGKPSLLARLDPQRAGDLALAGAVGALCGLYLDVELVPFAGVWSRDAAAGLCIGGAGGFALGAAPGLRDGAPARALRDAGRGLVAGAVGGSLGLVIGEVVLGLLQGGLIGRAVSWGILGLGIGLALGVAGRSRSLVGYGVMGGALGGTVGGFLFEALRLALGNRYDVGQGVGIVLLGAGLGLALALVEQTLRRAWVRVTHGRQEGRAYSLTHARNALGRDERAEVGLFGDQTVGRQHAAIVVEGRNYVLVPLDPHAATRVNGVMVADRRILHDGDRILLGQTPLTFHRR